MNRRTLKSTVLLTFVIGSAWLIASLPAILIPQLTWLPWHYFYAIYAALWIGAVLCIKELVADCTPSYLNLSKTLADESLGSRDLRICLMMAVLYGIFAKFFGTREQAVYLVKMILAVALMIIVRGVFVFYFRRLALVAYVYRWWITS